MLLDYIDNLELSGEEETMHATDLGYAPRFQAVYWLKPDSGKAALSLLNPSGIREPLGNLTREIQRMET